MDLDSIVLRSFDALLYNYEAVFGHQIEGISLPQALRCFLLCHNQDLLNVIAGGPLSLLHIYENKIYASCACNVGVCPLYYSLYTASAIYFNNESSLSICRRH